MEPESGDRQRLRGVLDELHAIDAQVSARIARAHTPRLDEGLRVLSRTADHSVLWIGIAAGMATFGGAKGRRAAVNGLASIAVASASANLLGKRLTRRARPDRELLAVPRARWVSMPSSTSFPSGHAASAFAFASGVGAESQLLALPVRVLAGAVAYSRVHTGVHYAGDVVGGMLVGVAASAVARSGLAVARAVRSSAG